MQSLPSQGDAPALPLIARSAYVRELRPHLPAHVFDRARSRILLLPVYVAIAAVAIAAITSGRLPWFALPIASLVIGFCFTSTAFVGHELLHGAILHGRRTQHVLGWLCFAPFSVSPALWIAWHNGIHHAHTNLPDDPDAYPFLATYHEQRGTRFAVDSFSPGGGRWRGVLSLLIGFTGQSQHELFTAHRQGYISKSQHRLAIAETVLAFAGWAALGLAIGASAFVFAFVLPLLVANAGVMAFILTNHALNPRVSINDPLVTGLTVTTSRLVERLTLGFGYHVEHHLFPAASTRHAREIRDHVRARWPERYQSMPLVSALLLLHRTARVYKNDTVLVDAKTGREYPTLAPGSAIAVPAEPAAAAAAPALCGDPVTLAS